MAADESWADAARAARDALALLGYNIAPRCLPGEPDACGATFAQHVAAYYGTVKAVTQHQLAHHLGLPYVEIAGDVFWEVTRQLDGHEQCQVNQ